MNSRYGGEGKGGGEIQRTGFNGEELQTYASCGIVCVYMVNCWYYIQLFWREGELTDRLINKSSINGKDQDIKSKMFIRVSYRTNLTNTIRDILVKYTWDIKQ
ncbi:hypothetical protein HanOQP8_Chr16g0633411 [Helianthus annuus]|nr:hypothetical protein HanHA89_Chr16g0678771 [Helianthus annuus]KAJ0646286.1 hypothetical protein HanOQP8_Chr16g0633411 [Helianthus annuus]